MMERSTKPEEERLEIHLINFRLLRQADQVFRNPHITTSLFTFYVKSSNICKVSYGRSPHSLLSPMP